MSLTVLSLAILGVLAGCAPDTELGGAMLPNAFPDTRLTSQPPTLRESHYVVRFYWTGSDPDGKVMGYHWKLTNNGTDGISLQDTLTIDPATGDTINPWRFTTRTDTTFYVSAELDSFPDDRSLETRFQRYFQTHTLFVRAKDDRGAVDPTPAMITFTATTVVPTIVVDRPSFSPQEASAVPTRVSIGYTGADTDFDLGVPTKVRFLWKEARDPAGGWIRTRYRYNQIYDQVLTFADSAWSDWQPYVARRDDRVVRKQYTKPAAGTPSSQWPTYFFAVQAMDTAGAVSVERTYGVNVVNFYVGDNIAPQLTFREQYLGQSNQPIVNYDIAQGQPLNFTWAASAESYAGMIAGYRYGWDVTDPDDEADPNWALQWGLSDQHKRAPTRTFDSGTHTLTIQCRDDSQNLSRITVVLSVVPVPQPADQKPLLLIDDVYDEESNAWPGSDGRAYDRDPIRDAFWEETLTGSGGVIGFSPVLDVVDTRRNPVFSYREAVNYRNLIWSTKKVSLTSYVDNNFNPDPRVGGEKFVWLGVYQQRVGNVLLTGQRVLNSFIGDVGLVTPRTPFGLPWITPIIFDTTEETHGCGSAFFAAGFGRRINPDGSEVWIGRERYPYAIWGIAALDIPSSDYETIQCLGVTQTIRKATCVGNKAILLDQAFKAAYLSPGAIADTIYTFRTIDYRDYNAQGFPEPTLTNAFVWGFDEFYDYNVTPRVTPIVPQVIVDPDAPSGVRPAIDVMFRMYTRFDWIDDVFAAPPYNDPGWPIGSYSGDDIISICGRTAVNPPTWRTAITGAPCGFVSHKVENTKPSGRGDVCWGFDPSRFNRVRIRQAIRWVLRDQFGLTLSP